MKTGRADIMNRISKVQVERRGKIAIGGFAQSALLAFGRILAATCVLMGLSAVAVSAQNALPYPESPFTGKVGPTTAQSVPGWPQQPKAPNGAPNVVLIILDDVGFGASATFGGPAATPELDKLAAQGLRYNAFNTDAICASTRAALLSGRNHHQVGFGNLPDIAAGFPGYNGVWHANTASIAEILKDNGYSTAAFGKWHNTPSWEASPAGPFNHWPTGLGFEYFYGFLGGESSEWEPRLYRDTTPVENPGRPGQGFHLTTAITNDAIQWLHNHSAVAPNKPFFLYFATGATHAPHQVPKEWIAKYKGQFDQGWDKVNEQTFDRQKKLGIIPANAERTPRPADLPAWDSLTPDQKKVYARQMEVYAAFLSHTDHEVGRLLQELKDVGLDKNTLVLYIIGDNGGSAEGGLEGSDHELASYVTAPESIGDQLGHLDDLGSPLYDNHYAAAWSWATSTPFQWMKQIASHFGGTRNGFVVSWPGHTDHSEVVRPQFSHVTDVVPTILEATHVQFPDSVNGVKQLPLEGNSLIPTFTDPNVPSEHREQYFEIFGNRAIYKDGWVAAARRYEPWNISKDFLKIYNGDFAHDKWELYHVDEDYSEAHDLADKFPDKLKDLQAEFDKEAIRNDVYPLTPFPGVGAPKIVPAGQTHFEYLAGVDRLTLDAVPELGGRSNKITADIDVPAGGAEGVVVALGGRYGGFSLYVKGGKLVYENNALGITHEKVVSSEPLPHGKVEVSGVFTLDKVLAAQHSLPGIAGLMAGGPRPGKAELFINGKKVGEGTFSQFGGFTSSITETFDVGKDTGSPVSAAYTEPYAFTGTVEKVSIDLIGAPISQVGAPISQVGANGPAATVGEGASAGHRYTTSATPLGDLLDDPAAKAVLQAHVPALVSNDRISLARGMTLKSLQQFAPNLTDATLAAIDAELAKLAPK
jgi:arylsulfatase